MPIPMRPMLLLLVTLSLIAPSLNASPSQVTQEFELRYWHDDKIDDLNEADTLACDELLSVVKQRRGKVLFHRDGRTILDQSRFTRPTWSRLELNDHHAVFDPGFSVDPIYIEKNEWVWIDQAKNANAGLAFGQQSVDLNSDGQKESLYELRDTIGFVNNPTLIFPNQKVNDLQTFSRGFTGDLVIHDETAYLIQFFSSHLRLLRASSLEEAITVCTIDLGWRIFQFKPQHPEPKYRRFIEFSEGNKYFYKVNEDGWLAQWPACDSLQTVATQLLRYGLKMSSPFYHNPEQGIEGLHWTHTSLAEVLKVVEPKFVPAPSNLRSYLGHTLSEEGVREYIKRGDLHISVSDFIPNWKYETNHIVTNQQDSRLYSFTWLVGTPANQSYGLYIHPGDFHNGSGRSSHSTFFWYKDESYLAGFHVSKIYESGGAGRSCNFQPHHERILEQYK